MNIPKHSAMFAELSARREARTFHRVNVGVAIVIIASLAVFLAYEILRTF